MINRVDTSSRVVEPPIPLWVITDWLGFVQPSPPGGVAVPLPEDGSTRCREERLKMSVEPGSQTKGSPLNSESPSPSKIRSGYRFVACFNVRTRVAG